MYKTILEEIVSRKLENLAPYEIIRQLEKFGFIREDEAITLHKIYDVDLLNHKKKSDARQRFMEYISKYHGLDILCLDQQPGGIIFDLFITGKLKEPDISNFVQQYADTEKSTTAFIRLVKKNFSQQGYF